MNYAFGRDVNDLLVVSAALAEWGLTFKVQPNFEDGSITDKITFVVEAAQEAVEAALERDLTVVYEGSKALKLRRVLTEDDNTCINIHFRDDDDGPAATVADMGEALEQIAEWVQSDSDVTIGDIINSLTVSECGTVVTMPETPGHEAVVWNLYQISAERADADYLFDLSEKLREVPATYGTDGGDVDRVREIAIKLGLQA